MIAQGGKNRNRSWRSLRGNFLLSPNILGIRDCVQRIDQATDEIACSKLNDARPAIYTYVVLFASVGSSTETGVWQSYSRDLNFHIFRFEFQLCVE